MLPHDPRVAARRTLMWFAAGIGVGLLTTSVDVIGTVTVVISIAVAAVLLVSAACPLLVSALLVSVLPLHGLIVSFLPENTFLRYWKEAMVVLLGIATIIRQCASRRSLSEDRGIRFSNLTVAAYVLYMSFRIVADGMSAVTPYAFATYVLYVALLVAIRDTVSSVGSMRAIVRAICIGATVVAIGAMVEEVLGIPISQRGIETALRYGRRRASFSVGSALVMGPYMVFALGLTLWLCRTTSRKSSFLTRVALRLCVLVQVVTLTLSGTRAAWIQALVSLAAYAAIRTTSMRRCPRGAGTILVLVALATSALILVGCSSARMFGGLDYQWERRSAWKRSVEIIGKNLLTGIGAGNTLWITSTLRDSAFVTESYILQVVVETGIVGGAMLLCVYASAVAGLIRSLSIRHGHVHEVHLLRATLLALLTGYLPALAIGQSLNAWVMLTVFWATMGLSFAVSAPNAPQ